MCCMFVDIRIYLYNGLYSMKKIVICLIISILFFGVSCKKNEDNKVPMEQIQIDGSHDFSIIFKDIIKKEKKDASRYKKGPFDE